jgi:hypothetical protein
MANTANGRAVAEPTTDASHSDAPAFSLVQGGPPYRIQRKLGLIPRNGLGIARRMLFFMLFPGVPIMAWALVNGRVWRGVAPEPLLQHFGVHVRCLVAIPLFMATEAVAEAISQRILPYFITSGLVTDASRSRFIEILHRAMGLRNSWLAWAILAALAVLPAWRFMSAGEALYQDELSWALSSEAGVARLGFGDSGFCAWYARCSPSFCCIGSRG